MDVWFGQGFGLLSEVYLLIDHYIFNDVMLTFWNNGDILNAQMANIDLIITLFSVCAVGFLVAVPFILLIRIIKLLGGR